MKKTNEAKSNLEAPKASRSGKAASKKANRSGKKKTDSMSAKPWLNYKEGAKDQVDRPIDQIFAKKDRPGYVIYRSGLSLCIDGDEIVQTMMAELAAQFGPLFRFMPKALPRRTPLLIQITHALELAAKGKTDDAKCCLSSLQMQLDAAEVGQARLHYLWAAITITTVIWLAFYVSLLTGIVANTGFQWFQASALGALGGLFSVGLTQQNIPVDLNQPKIFYWTTGMTRIVIIGLIAGVLSLLVIKAGIALNLAEKSSDGYSPLFFAFLAGFSESFAQNILRNHGSTGNNRKVALPSTRDHRSNSSS